MMTARLFFLSGCLLAAVFTPAIAFADVNADAANLESALSTRQSDPAAAQQQYSQQYNGGTTTNGAPAAVTSVGSIPTDSGGGGGAGTGNMPAYHYNAMNMQNTPQPNGATPGTQVFGTQPANVPPGQQPGQVQPPIKYNVSSRYGSMGDGILATTPTPERVFHNVDDTYYFIKNDNGADKP